MTKRQKRKALSVLMKMAKEEIGILDILRLDDMNIRGPQIWIGYKDVAKQDMPRFIGLIRKRDPVMITKINVEMSMDKSFKYEATSFRHERKT